MTRVVVATVTPQAADVTRAATYAGLGEQKSRAGTTT